MNPLETYVQAWQSSTEALLDLLASVDEDDWTRATDLPGWQVRDVVAHLAHLESVLVGHEEDVALPEASREVAADYTEAGVRARQDRTPAELVAQLRAAVAQRVLDLTPLPEDPTAPATPTPGSVPWTWDTALRNRAVDSWCHEQDVRRAIDRPGNLDSLGAVVTTHTFAAGLPFVLGKRVAAQPGTSVRWTLTGALPMELGATVGEDGRATSGVPDSPTTSLTMTSETFAILAAGRRGADDVQVGIDGDQGLGRAVLGAMALTP